jgi:hypothetical protein
MDLVESKTPMVHSPEEDFRLELQVEIQMPGLEVEPQVEIQIRIWKWNLRW